MLSSTSPGEGTAGGSLVRRRSLEERSTKATKAPRSPAPRPSLRALLVVVVSVAARPPHHRPPANAGDLQVAQPVRARPCCGAPSAAGRARQRTPMLDPGGECGRHVPHDPLAPPGRGGGAASSPTASVFTCQRARGAACAGGADKARTPIRLGRARPDRGTTPSRERDAGLQDVPAGKSACSRPCRRARPRPVPARSAGKSMSALTSVPARSLPPRTEEITRLRYYT
jgi:hypothetical protein